MGTRGNMGLICLINTMPKGYKVAYIHSGRFLPLNFIWSCANKVKSWAFGSKAFMLWLLFFSVYHNIALQRCNLTFPQTSCQIFVQTVGLFLCHRLNTPDTLCSLGSLHVNRVSIEHIIFWNFSLEYGLSGGTRTNTSIVYITTIQRRGQGGVLGINRERGQTELDRHCELPIPQCPEWADSWKPEEC